MLAACLPLLLAAPLVAHTSGPATDGGVETDTVEVVVQLVDPFYRPIPNGIVRLGTTEAQVSHTGAGGSTGVFHASPGTHELILGETEFAGRKYFGEIRSISVPPVSASQPRTGLFHRLSQPAGFGIVLTAPGPGDRAADFLPEGQIPFWNWITLEGHEGRIPLECGVLQRPSTIEGVLRYYGHSDPVPQYSRAVVFETDGATLDVPLILQIDLIDTDAADGAAYDVHHFAPIPGPGGASGPPTVPEVVPPTLVAAPHHQGFGFLQFEDRLPAGIYVVAARPGAGTTTFRTAPSSPPVIGEPTLEAGTGSEDHGRCVVEPAGPAPDFSCPAPGPGAWSRLSALERGCPIEYDGVIGCSSDVAPSSAVRCGGVGSSTGIERTEVVELEGTSELVSQLDRGVSTTHTVSSKLIETHAFQPGADGCGQCYRTFARVDLCVHGYTTYRNGYRPPENMPYGSPVELEVIPCITPHSFRRVCTSNTILQETCDREQAP